MIKFKYMKLPKSNRILFVICLIHVCFQAQVSGIYQTKNYLKYLESKKVGLVVNHTSIINNTHLIDTLLNMDIHVVSVFTPEHGFSGLYNAGEYVEDDMYKNKIPIISLYGKNKIIKDADLNNIEVIVFDIQDVGVRFYTYISTLHYVMEACARNNVKLIILDRPNPHAHYVDGPILNLEYSSFVGMHPVPIVYGMTVGEFAYMINGEGWLNSTNSCDVTVIPLQSYSRFDKINYTIYPPPSPNLPTTNSILLYPSLCLFEGTLISVGRGTDYPFEVFGAPFFESNSAITDFEFTPRPNSGAKKPKYNGDFCKGWLLSNSEKTIYFNFLRRIKNHNFNQISLQFLIDAYAQSPIHYKKSFFNNFFNNLAGTNELKKQIINNKTEDEIRRSWQSGIKEFKEIREKYLLYD